MAKVMYRVEIDVPSSMPRNCVLLDLKEAAQGMIDAYQSYSDKKLKKPIVRRLKVVEGLIAESKRYYE